MTQTLPLSIVLGSANTGKIIGYTVLNLNRSEYAAFAIATESDVSGTYYALGGYAAPDAGGYVVVSESDGLLPATLTALAEVDIEPNTNQATINDILEDTGTTLPALINTRSTLGAGTLTFVYTLTNSVTGLPIADADVWATTDTGGTNVLASGRTNASGQVTFYLDAGTVYVWRQKSGWNFVNPDTETIS